MKLTLARPRNLTTEKTVALAVSKEEKRPVLTHVHTDGDKLVAADGFRLHYAPNTGAHDCKWCEKNQARFPDYPQLFPKKFNTVVSLDADDFRGALTRSAVFAREGSSVALLTICPAFMNVVGTSEEFGSSKNTVAVTVDLMPDAFVFLGVNWLYMREALDHVAPKGGTVTLQIVNSTSPMVLTGPAEGHGALLMPMQTGDYAPSLEPVTELPAVSYKELSQPATIPAHTPSPEPVRDWDTAAQTEPEPYYTASPDLTSKPAPGATFGALAITTAKECEKEYGRGKPEVMVILEVTPGAPIEQTPEPEQPVTKSERMAALNVERARIMREYKPGPERTELLQALYTAFGNSQRKNPRPSWELPGIACGMNARFNNVIIDRRIAHNITGALCDIHHPAIMTSDTILTPAKSL